MKNQVLTIEQMQYLEELGVDMSKASMAFIKLPSVGKFEDDPVSNSERIFEYIVAMKYIPTFTLQDILELLTNVRYNSVGFPVLIFDYVFSFKYWQITLRNPCDFDFPECKNGNPIEAAYQALVWCAQNGYFKGGGK